MILRRHLACAAVLLAPALVLAACSDEAADVEESGDGLSATGEVLEPTVSDAMIPTDQLRSAAPLLRTQPSSGATGDGGEPGEGENGTETDGAVETASETAPLPEDEQAEPAE